MVLPLESATTATATASTTRTTRITRRHTCFGSYILFRATIAIIVVAVYFVVLILFDASSLLSLDLPSSRSKVQSRSNSNSNSNTPYSSSTFLADPRHKRTKKNKFSSSHGDFETTIKSKQLLNKPECQNGVDGGNDHGDHSTTTTTTTTTARSSRWSQRDFPKSDVPSLFNCDLPDALCTYYFPADFLDETCGLGKEYAHYAQDAQDMMHNGTLWDFMPSIGFPTITLKHACFDLDITVYSDNPRERQKQRWQKKQKQKQKNKRLGLRESKYKKANGVETISLSGDILSNLGEHIVSVSDTPNNDDEEEEEGDEDGNEEQQQRCLTERLTMLHVHKAGGSSLHNALNALQRNNVNSSLARYPFFTPTRQPGSETTILSKTKAKAKQQSLEPKKKAKAEMYQHSLQALSHATKYPSTKLQADEHVMFAVVRDPTERFISSIGQAAGAMGSEGNRIGPVLKRACIKFKSTARETLKCMAKYVKTHGFWIELHFTPQVIDLAFTSMRQDVPVGIFPFKEGLPAVLKYLDSENVQLRNGQSDEYRSNDVLKDMSVDDYDDESLKLVCEIYEMDVIMQRSLGMEVPRCDPYIPRRHRGGGGGGGSRL